MPTSNDESESEHLEIKGQLAIERIKILRRRAAVLRREHQLPFGDSDDALDVLRFYLMQKHDWLPRDVRALSEEELEFATDDVRVVSAQSAST